MEGLNEVGVHKIVNIKALVSQAEFNSGQLASRRERIRRRPSSFHIIKDIHIPAIGDYNIGFLSIVERRTKIPKSPTDLN